jgi:hypothetical protein
MTDGCRSPPEKQNDGFSCIDILHSFKNTQQCQSTAAVFFLVNHSKTMDINRNLLMDYNDDNLLEDEDAWEVVDVIPVGLDTYMSALIETESDHFEMAHFINDYPIIFELFNELLRIFFQMELTRSTNSGLHITLLNAFGPGELFIC